MDQDQASEAAFSSLPPYQPRSFVPQDADLGNAEEVASLYQQLLDRRVASAEQLQEWLLARSELDSAVSQKRAILSIRMTCQTDDPDRAGAYKHFVETVVPAVRTSSDKLDRKYLADRERFHLDAGRFAVHDRNIRADVEQFRAENVPLKTEESLLAQEYQTITGAMTVNFQGRERTLQEMRKFLEEPDRPLRESAWRALSGRRLAEKDRLEKLFDQMLGVRAKIAANADCADFCEYQFRHYHRFDYTPDDCKAYHAAVESVVVPLCREITERRRQRMSVETLRPWDLSADPDGQPPLKPFEEPKQLVAGAVEIFTRLDPDLGEQLAKMRELGMLDLGSRKGKAPGGYLSSLDEARRPFIFMNAVGRDGDLRTLLHEAGHAFHALACVDEPLLAYRDPPLEFCEVASMGMELLAGEHLDVFYDDQARVRSRREHLEGIIFILSWVATIDAFQQWIYAHPGQSSDERRAAWEETFSRFGEWHHGPDWTGLEEERAYRWHAQQHIFTSPFYYIEYGIAQLGALQLWARAREDLPAALADYRQTLALGGSRPLPELFETAGLRFDFSEQTIAPLMDMVRQELQRL